MTSIVSICNRALIMVGAPTIENLNDNSEEARLCNHLFTIARDYLLSAHPWNFAIKRSTLTPLSTAPNHEYTNQYQIPSDCLRVLRIYSDSGDEDWIVEGGNILTKRSTSDAISIVYVFRNTDSSMYRPYFAIALSAYLATELAQALNRTNEMYNQLFEVFNFKIREARSLDAQEGRPMQFFQNTWLDSREF